MKMIYNGTPVNSMKVKHYEVSTADATLKPFDMQAGITAYAKGKKVVGTGRCFEFARYGFAYTNVPTPIPSMINFLEVASLSCPIQLSMELNKMSTVDFSISQNIGNAIIDGQSYPLSVAVSDNKMTISCNKTIKLETFYGRDHYV